MGALYGRGSSLSRQKPIKHDKICEHYLASGFNLRHLYSIRDVHVRKQSGGVFLDVHLAECTRGTFLRNGGFIGTVIMMMSRTKNSFVEVEDI